MDYDNQSMSVQHMNPSHCLEWRIYKICSKSYCCCASHAAYVWSQTGMEALKGSESPTEQNVVQLVHHTCIQEELNVTLHQDTGHND
jgi:hypothetical protein